MSELINNQEFRQKKLKELIQRLHDGASVEEVKAEFEQLTLGVRASEIATMEQELVREGMPVSEIQRLCDVHAAVFKGTIEEIHALDGMDEAHPVETFKNENRAIEKLIERHVFRLLEMYNQEPSHSNKEKLLETMNLLSTIDKHYTRKESLIFPYMERHDFTAPPQVMWGVDDEIRKKIKEVQRLLREENPLASEVNDKIQEVALQVNEMIFKEEQIMIPMIQEVFSLQEWESIEQASAEIGYTLLQGVGRWNSSAQVSSQEKLPISKNKTVESMQRVDDLKNDRIQFDAGTLTREEVNEIFNTVPLDMTFVGRDNRVKYFTQGEERIFHRPLTVLGREVKHCHPPKSVHIVEEIVDDLRNGVKDCEDFWIQMGDRFVLIRYFAVRGKNGEFLGTLEVNQNIKPLRELQGEKRLRDIK